MADTVQNKLDLVIGAWDKFSAPFKAFEQRLTVAGDAVQRFKAKAESLSGATGFSRLASSVGGVSGSLLQVGQAAGDVFGRITAGAGKLSLLLGGASGGLLALATGVGAAGENASIFAQKAGVALESFQKLAYGASFSNIQTEEFSVMLGKLGKTTLEAATGNKEFAAAFKLAGIQLKDNTGKIKNADFVLLELADTFSKMQDGPAKTALATKLLGEEGLKLLPFLNQGSTAIRGMAKDAEKLGIVFDQAGSQQSADFNKSLGDVQYALKGLGYTIGIESMPVLMELMGEFKAWIMQNRELLGLKVKEWVGGFAARLPEIISGARSFATGLAKLAEGLGRFSDMLGGADNFMLLVAAALSGPLLTALYGAASAFAALGAAILTTPVGWIMAAIAALAAGAWWIINNWEGVKNFFVELGTILPDIFTDFLSVFDDVGTAFAAVWGDMVDTVKKALAALGALMPDFGALVPDFLKKGWGKLTGGKEEGQDKPEVEGKTDEQYRLEAETEKPGGNRGQNRGWGRNIFATQQLAPAGSAALLGETAKGLHSSTTKVERSEVRLILPPGFSTQGGENATGVQVDESGLGSMGLGD